MSPTNTQPQNLAEAGLGDLDATFLPVGQMRQISRVIECEGSVIIGEVDLGPDHWVYGQHFPGDPIFPGVLVIEAAGQLVALWAWANGLRGRPRLVRTGAEFRSPIGPTVPCLVLRGEVTKKRNLHFATVNIQAGDVDVATVTAVLAVLPDVEQCS